MDTTELLNKIVERHDLTAQETQEFLDAVMNGEVSPVQTGGILTALRMKGESVNEILGLVRVMRSRMLSVNAPGAIDIVGTGGDGSGTFNISTAAAFVVAGAGVPVAKHGSRAASSACGSADVLEALGVTIQLTPEQAHQVLDRAGMVFLFAPAYHPATKQVVAVRKELKIRTIFNVLGPLANPASVRRQLMGVSNPALAKKMAQVAKTLKYEHLLLVSSKDGMDEISTSAKTDVFEVRGATIKKYAIDPAKYGFKKVPKSALQGGTAQENAQIIRDILAGAKGPKRDIVVLNAAFALLVAGAVRDAKEGIARAEASIDSGKAAASLRRLLGASQKFAAHQKIKI